jgi:hypothetical protein
VILPHGRHDYRIAHRTARQIGCSTGTTNFTETERNGMEFRVRSHLGGSHAPAGVPAQVTPEAYTGPRRGRNYRLQRAIAAPSSAPRAIAPREGMTIVVAFPGSLRNCLDRPGRRVPARQRRVAAGLGGYLVLAAFPLAAGGASSRPALRPRSRATRRRPTSACWRMLLRPPGATTTAVSLPRYSGSEAALRESPARLKSEVPEAIQKLTKMIGFDVGDRMPTTQRLPDRAVRRRI